MTASARGSWRTTSFLLIWVTRNRRVAEAALRPWRPVFMHGDLQVAHVFVDDDEITGVVDWSEAGQGDAMYDLASLTLGHPEHLSDVIAGYGADVDHDVIHAWWSLRRLLRSAGGRARLRPGLPRLRDRRYREPSCEPGHELHRPDPAAGLTDLSGGRRHDSGNAR